MAGLVAERHTPGGSLAGDSPGAKVVGRISSSFLHYMRSRFTDNQIVDLMPAEMAGKLGEFLADLWLPLPIPY